MPVSMKGINDQSSLSSGGPVNLTNPLEVQNQALQILANNCTSCHSQNAGPLNVFNLTDVNHLTQSGLVIPGSPDTSPLLQSIEANRMPKAGPLGAADKLVIRTWISNGVLPPSATPGGAPPTSGPPPVTNPPQAGLPTLTPTFASLQANIFQPKCVGCHSVARPGIPDLSNYNVISLSQTILDIKKDMISGSMPKGGPPLSTVETNAVMDWIAAGAKNN